MSGVVIVMAKRPAPGATKTRLTPALSPQGSAALYECFLQDALEIARAVPGVTRAIAYPPQDGRVYFRQLAGDFELVPQIGATLGQRLAYVLDACLGHGQTPAVAMSSDTPTLPVEHVTRALAWLVEGGIDVVLGPCEDGGYYLIGLTVPRPRLLLGVAMSTPHVLADTLALAAEHGLRVGLLPVWYDVDAPEDLGRLKADLAMMAPTTARHTRVLLGIGQVLTA